MGRLRDAAVKRLGAEQAHIDRVPHRHRMPLGGEVVGHPLVDHDPVTVGRWNRRAGTVDEPTHRQRRIIEGQDRGVGDRRRRQAPGSGNGKFVDEERERSLPAEGPEDLCGSPVDLGREEEPSARQTEGQVVVAHLLESQAMVFERRRERPPHGGRIDGTDGEGDVRHITATEHLLRRRQGNKRHPAGHLGGAERKPTHAARREHGRDPQPAAERRNRPSPQRAVGGHIGTLGNPEDDGVADSDAEVAGEHLVEGDFVAAHSRQSPREAERRRVVAGEERAPG
jgi:hypothetical protein